MGLLSHMWNQAVEYDFIKNRQYIYGLSLMAV